MDKTKTAELEKLLEADDLNGVSFAQSKRKLMKLGYSEGQISIAVAHNSFDGKKNAPKVKAESVYSDDPATANLIGKELLALDEEKRRRDINSEATKLAVGYPGISGANPITSKAFVNLNDYLGIPIFKIGFIGMFIAAALYGMHTLGFFDVSVVLNFTYLFIGSVAIYIAIISIKSAIWSAKVTAPEAGKQRSRYFIGRLLITGVMIALLAAIYLTV